MDIDKITFNPLLGNICGSIGSIDEYEKEQEKIQKDPRYPQWKAEADAHRMSFLAREKRIAQEASDLLEKYAMSQPTHGNKLQLYIWQIADSYEGSWIGIIASDIETAKFILAKTYKKNKDLQSYGDEAFVEVMNNAPDIIDTSNERLAFIHSWSG